MSLTDCLAFSGTTGNASYWQNKSSPSAVERAGGMRLWYNDCGALSAARKPATTPAGDGCYDGPVLCQHGPNECASNLFEACVVKLEPTPQRFWPFVACYEGKSIGRDPHTDADIPKQQMYSCVKELNDAAETAGQDKYDLDAIEECATRDHVELERQAGERTASLNPAHGGTPYILVAGKISGAENALKDVCKSYTGASSDLPTVCAQFL